jgi:hypothetical protein
VSENFISDPDVATHTGFLLAEEAALKLYVSGLEVPNPRSPGELDEVPVWFRWPESERRISYPFITLDLLSITPAYERWHSVHDQLRVPSHFRGSGDTPDRWGHYYPGYTPEIDMAEGKTYGTDRYLPYNLIFQVSTFTRSAYHDRFLTSRFITDIFPPRGNFWIDVEADHVARRCELLQWVSGDTMETNEAAKRMFRKIYTVLMETEVPESKVYEYDKVDSVHVDLYDKRRPEREAVGHSVEGTHTVAISSSTFVEPAP